MSPIITEVETDKPAWPCCPLMSGYPVQVSPPNGKILQPNQVAIGPMLVPCVGEDCPLFYNERCSLYKVQHIDTIAIHFADLANALRDLKLILEPPKDSPSPLMRVANSLAEIVENIKKKG